MDKIPYDLKDIVKEVVDFYGRYFKFKSAVWHEDKSLLILEQQSPADIKDIDTTKLVKSLRKIIPHFSSNDLINYSNGNIGIIIRDTNLEETISDLPMEMYVNIAKELDLNSLNNLCVTDEQFRDLCNNDEFWRRLLIERFNLKITKDSSYNYKKIYKGLLKIGGIDKLGEYLSDFKGIIDYENAMYASESMVDSLIYAFNNAPAFKHNVLNNAEKSFIMISILLITGNLDKAIKFVDMYKSIHQSVPRISLSFTLRNVVASYFVKNHNYEVIDFLKNYYSEYLRKAFDYIGEKIKIFDNEDLRKLLTDPRFDENTNDILLLSFSSKLSYETFMNDLSVYKSDISPDFIRKYFRRLLRSENTNSIKKVLDNYGHIMTYDYLKESLEWLLSREDGQDFTLDENDLKVMYILLNAKQMKEKLNA